jgi:hypothetical protein
MRQQVIYILWPSFIVAGVAETVFFTLFDPSDLAIFGEPLELSRLAVYSLGFFLFWVFAAASSAFTCFLQRGSDEINRR